MRNKIIRCLIFLVLIIMLLFMFNTVGRGEFINIIKWYGMLLLMTITGLPITFILFNKFFDKGYIFSKPIGMLISGFTMWFLSSLRILQFNTFNSFICTIIVFVISLLVIKCRCKRDFNIRDYLSVVFKYELFFLILFMIACYVKGFNPSANTTEKFMDYGYMAIIYKTKYMPPIDLWFAGKVINYYYFGQYISTFLTKLALLKVSYGYNFMIITLFSLSFFESFSIVYNLLKLNNKEKKAIPCIGGVIAGVSNTIAGNMHYVIYGLFIPFFSKIGNISVWKDYYFPDSTRYIGYNPDTIDKTIHEFPSYSFVLGDLHAHVINIIFVLLLLALLLSYLMSKNRENKLNIGQVISPMIVFIGIVLGLYKMTNYWDFVIYFVVISLIFIFKNIKTFDKFKDIILLSFFQILIIVIISSVISIPFSINFIKMSSKVKLVPYRSPFYQLLVLWGLPVLLFIFYFIITLFKISIRKLKSNKIINYIRNIELSDLYIIVIGLCAIGLIIIPEIVYVVDIYVNNIRANTMFKLTYQSYIMFGLCFGYILTILILNKNKCIKVITGIFFTLFILTLGYIMTSVNSWFGDVSNRDGYKSLDAMEFFNDGLLVYGVPKDLKSYANSSIDMKDDLKAILWLNKNAKDSDVILESYGNSYTYFNRISTFTGLSTPLGWMTHEWLWRSVNSSMSIPKEVEERMRDIDMVYSYTNQKEIEKVIRKYHVTYLVIGYYERLKYANGGALLNEDILLNLGTVVYESNLNQQNEPMYIIKIKNR